MMYRLLLYISSSEAPTGPGPHLSTGAGVWRRSFGVWQLLTQNGEPRTFTFNHQLRKGFRFNSDSVYVQILVDPDPDHPQKHFWVFNQRWLVALSVFLKWGRYKKKFEYPSWRQKQSHQQAVVLLRWAPVPFEEPYTSDSFTLKVLLCPIFIYKLVIISDNKKRQSILFREVLLHDITSRSPSRKAVLLITNHHRTVLVTQ